MLARRKKYYAIDNGGRVYKIVPEFWYDDDRSFNDENGVYHNLDSMLHPLYPNRAKALEAIVVSLADRLRSLERQTEGGA